MNSTIKKILANEIDPAYAKRSAYIFSVVENHKPKTVLDTGCGRGFYIKALNYYPFIKSICGIDINEAYVAKAKRLCAKEKKTQVKKASIYDLPFKKNSFDCVISSEIFEHLDDEKKALAEIDRVLKPNGVIIFTVPNERFPFLWDPLNWLLMRVFHTHINKDIWWLAGMWADHVRLYKKEAFVKLVQGGFIVTNTKDFVHWSWPLSHFFLYGVGKNIVERIPSKNFNRFEFTQDKPLSRALAQFVAFPSRLLDERFPTEASVDIGVTAIKKSSRNKK